MLPIHLSLGLPRALLSVPLLMYALFGMEWHSFQMGDPLDSPLYIA